MTTTAHARRTHPETSHMAAESVKGISELQQRIIEVFKEHGAMTDEKLIENYAKLWGRSFPASDSGIRSRRCDLVRDGYLSQTPIEGRTENGRKSAVWGISGVLF